MERVTMMFSELGQCTLFAATFWILMIIYALWSLNNNRRFSKLFRETEAHMDETYNVMKKVTAVRSEQATALIGIIEKVGEGNKDVDAKHLEDLLNRYLKLGGNKDA